MPKIDGLRGAAVVTRGGSVVLEAASGPADALTGSPCTVQTRFQIASISKQFAAVAVLLLAERGALRLDESIARWFPDCPAQWQAITPHHLLTHTSGIGHWSDIPGFVVSQPMDLEERLALFQRAPLRTAPGAQWHYSSPGYLLVGHIVEHASGQPYATFLTEQVLTPLDLTSTSAGPVPPGADTASGHRDGQPVPTWDLAMMAGTGDVWSTVGDLARYTIAINSGALLSSDSRQARQARHTPLADQSAGPDEVVLGQDYGYGVFIGIIGGATAYFHPGDNPGFVSFNAWLPEHDATIAILTNDETTNIDHLVQQLLPAARGDST